jgi:hypothetical protein
MKLSMSATEGAGCVGIHSDEYLAGRTRTDDLIVLFYVLLLQLL